MISSNAVNQLWGDYQTMLNANPRYKAEEIRLYQEQTRKPAEDFEKETKLMFKRTAKVYQP